MTTIIDDRELQDLVTKMSACLSGAERLEVMAAVGRRVGVKAESLVPEYPPPSGKPLPHFYLRTTAFGRQVRPFLSKFKSDKQAYFVLKLGQAGKIPYRRSRQLGNSITSAVREVTTTSVAVAVGPNLRSASRVIGNDAEQSHYFRGHWWQLNKVISNGAAELAAEAGRAFAAEIRRRVK